MGVVFLVPWKPDGLRFQNAKKWWWWTDGDDGGGGDDDDDFDFDGDGDGEIRINWLWTQNKHRHTNEYTVLRGFTGAQHFCERQLLVSHGQNHSQKRLSGVDARFVVSFKVGFLARLVGMFDRPGRFGPFWSFLIFKTCCSILWHNIWTPTTSGLEFFFESWDVHDFSGDSINCAILNCDDPMFSKMLKVQKSTCQNAGLAWPAWLLVWPAWLKATRALSKFECW